MWMLGWVAAFRFELGFDEGAIALVGLYRTVEPVSRLVFTWGVEGEADDSKVTVLLAPTVGGTQLRLEHRGLSPDEIAQNEAGWGEFFDRLEEALLDSGVETQLGG